MRVRLSPLLARPTRLRAGRDNSLRTVQAERCASPHGVPTTFIAELERARFVAFDTTSLGAGIEVDSSCSLEITKKMRSYRNTAEATIRCGMTETSLVSARSAPDGPFGKTGPSSRAGARYVQIKIVDPGSEAVVSRGTPGEIAHAPAGS